MWERASCSCSQENVFMGDLKSSVSPCSCHCTQWTGVASSVTENKYSSTQTTDISYRHDKSHLCLHVPHCASLVSLTWAAWQTTLPVSQELLRYRLIFLPSCFSEMAHQISVKCKHVQGRAGGWQGDWWRAAERPSACVCVLCLSADLWVRSLTTSTIPPSASYSPGTCQPDVEPLHRQLQIPPPQHGDPHSRNAAPTFTSLLQTGQPEA